MKKEIICPNCETTFDISEVIDNLIDKKLKEIKDELDKKELNNKE